MFQIRQLALSGMSSPVPGASAAVRRSIFRRALTGAAMVLGGIGLAGCWLFPAEWNEKLTVTVSTPHGDVSGSSVRWQQLYEDPVLGNAQPDMRGEAVVVEVAEGRYLFALIEDHRPQAELMFFPGEAPLKSTYKLNRRKGDVLDVPRDMYPMLIAFGNLDDPASVTEVDPSNLAASFGPGYELRSITLEITDAPVTEGRVANLIPWILTHNTRLKEIPVPTPPDYIATPVENLWRLNFIWGIP